MARCRCPPVQSLDHPPRGRCDLVRNSGRSLKVSVLGGLQVKTHMTSTMLFSLRPDRHRQGLLTTLQRQWDHASRGEVDQHSLVGNEGSIARTNRLRLATVYPM